MHHIPKDLYYTKSHEWIKFTDGGALIGITDFAQNAMGDVVFVNLCPEGDTLETDDSLGDIESIKAVSEIYAPLAGTVARVNQDVLDAPGDLNTKPYDAWLVELSGDFDKDSPGLMTPEAYEAFLQEEA